MTSRDLPVGVIHERAVVGLVLVHPPVPVAVAVRPEVGPVLVGPKLGVAVL